METMGSGDTTKSPLTLTRLRARPGSVLTSRWMFDPWRASLINAPFLVWKEQRATRLMMLCL